MTPVENAQLSDGFGRILEAIGAFERNAEDRYASKEDLKALADAVEGIRANAKGANNWSKITVAMLGALPALLGVAKGLGFF